MIRNLFFKSARRLYAEIVGRLAAVRLRASGVDLGINVRFWGMPIVSLAPNSRIRIGNRAVLTSWSAYTALGVSHPVVLRTLAPGAELIMGDDVGISGGTICAAKRVVIGERSMLGANVTIVDTDFHPLHSYNRRYAGSEGANAAEVVIGSNVFIGANAIVLKGVRIGDNAVIGAGSVVTRDVPPNVIAAGNPCKVIRELSEEKKSAKR